MDSFTFEKKGSCGFFEAIKWFKPVLKGVKSNRIAMTMMYLRRVDSDLIELGVTDAKRVHFVRVDIALWAATGLNVPLEDNKDLYMIIYGSKDITIIRQSWLEYPNIAQIMPNIYAKSSLIKFNEIVKMSTIYNALIQGEITMNHDFITDCTEVMDGEIRIRYNNNTSPVLFDSVHNLNSNIHCYAIIMPIRNISTMDIINQTEIEKFEINYKPATPEVKIETGEAPIIIQDAKIEIVPEAKAVEIAA